VGEGKRPTSFDELSGSTTKSRLERRLFRAGATGLEPATSGVTGRRSNQLNYAPDRGAV
jgi:hypothetical protein